MVVKCGAEVVWALLHICNLDDGHAGSHECGGCSATWDDAGNTSGLAVVSAYPVEVVRAAEFDALLVGEPTSGGLIRHRARRLGFVRRLLGLGRP